MPERIPAQRDRVGSASPAIRTIPKLTLARALPPFVRPVFCARPKTENCAATKIVHDLKINHPTRDHITDHFQAKAKLEKLALRFRVQVIDVCGGSTFRDLAE